ncbi:MAG: hypothetical protein R3E76_03030 [Planctomycetota bacterium]
MRPTRKFPLKPPSDLHGPLGALQLEIRVDLRENDEQLTTSTGSGSVIFSGKHWASEAIWTAVQVLENDFECSREEVLEALRMVAQRIDS